MTIQTDPTTANPPKPLDPEKILTNPDEWQRELVGNVVGVVQQAVAQNAATTFEALSEAAKHLSRSDPKNAPIWEKYGAEIEALASSPLVDPRLKGSKAYWDKAAKIIQAEHLDDVIAERAQSLAAQMRTVTETGEGSYGAASPAQSSAMDKIRESAYGKKLIERYGERGVLRNVEKLGVSLDAYAKMVAETNVVVNPHNPAEWYNRDIVRGA